MPTWEKILLRSAGFGAGFAVVVCAVVGAVVWYSGRPKPPKPWNTTAVKAAGPPSVYVRKVKQEANSGNWFSPDSKSQTDWSDLEFIYAVHNNSDIDYKIDSVGQIKVLLKGPEGRFDPPNVEIDKVLEVPVFIPARQTGTLSVSFTGNLPKRGEHETDNDYDERVKVLWDRNLIADIVLFDESNRYQIDLPGSLPANHEPADPLGLFGPDKPDLQNCLKQVDPNDPLGIRTKDLAKDEQRKVCFDKYGARNH